MNIHSQNTGKCSYQSFKAVPANYKLLPEAVGKIAQHFAEYINTPEQKLLLASSTLLFQPLIDLKFAEEDKKVDSAIKSASKAIAGGITGVPIRALFIAFARYIVQPKDLHKKRFGGALYEHLQNSFWPEANRKLWDTDPFRANLRLKPYVNTIGTMMAIIFMWAFSNSKLDVPLTGCIQDILTKVIKQKKPWSEAISEVVTDRKKKFEAWKLKKKETITNIVDKSKNISSLFKKDLSSNKDGAK